MHITDIFISYPKNIICIYTTFSYYQKKQQKIFLSDGKIFPFFGGGSTSIFFWKPTKNAVEWYPCGLNWTCVGGVTVQYMKIPRVDKRSVYRKLRTQSTQFFFKTCPEHIDSKSQNYSLIDPCVSEIFRKNRGGGRFRPPPGRNRVKRMYAHLYENFL